MWNCVSHKLSLNNIQSPNIKQRAKQGNEPNFRRSKRPISHFKVPKIDKGQINQSNYWYRQYLRKNHCHSPVDSLIILVNKNQMIKNSHYSYEYFQPEDYRFSLDSVFLAQVVARKLESHPNPEELSVLDLCAGCGVIGLELQFHLKGLKKIDFLEVQDVYRSYFEKNVQQAKKADANKDAQFNFLNLNYEALLSGEFKDRYDIIISNPPYFFQGEGLLSPNDFKNRCRFFIDSDFKTLVMAILNSLKPEGTAYVLARPGSHHGRNLYEEIKSQARGLASVQIVDEVRGTNVVELIKKI